MLVIRMEWMVPNPPSPEEPENPPGSPNPVIIEEGRYSLDGSSLSVMLHPRSFERSGAPYPPTPTVANGGPFWL